MLHDILHKGCCVVYATLPSTLYHMYSIACMLSDDRVPCPRCTIWCRTLNFVPEFCKYCWFSMKYSLGELCIRHLIRVMRPVLERDLVPHTNVDWLCFCLMIRVNNNSVPQPASPETKSGSTWLPCLTYDTAVSPISTHHRKPPPVIKRGPCLSPG